MVRTILSRSPRSSSNHASSSITFIVLTFTRVLSLLVASKEKKFSISTWSPLIYFTLHFQFAINSSAELIFKTPKILWKRDAGNWPRHSNDLPYLRHQQISFLERTTACYILRKKKEKRKKKKKNDCQVARGASRRQQFLKMSFVRVYSSNERGSKSFLVYSLSSFLRGL